MQSIDNSREIYVLGYDAGGRIKLNQEDGRCHSCSCSTGSAAVAVSQWSQSREPSGFRRLGYIRIDFAARHDDKIVSKTVSDECGLQTKSRGRRLEGDGRWE